MMPSEDTKTLVFNQYKKFDKALFIIYEDLECLIKKIDGLKNKLENHPQQKYVRSRFVNVYNIVV